MKRKKIVHIYVRFEIWHVYITIFHGIETTKTKKMQFGKHNTKHNTLTVIFLLYMHWDLVRSVFFSLNMFQVLLLMHQNCYFHHHHHHHCCHSHHRCHSHCCCRHFRHSAPHFAWRGDDLDARVPVCLDLVM